MHSKDHLKIFVLADSLYASEPVFEKCIRDSGWHFLIRYKDGSMLSAAEQCHSIGGSDSSKTLEILQMPGKRWCIENQGFSIRKNVREKVPFKAA